MNDGERRLWVLNDEGLYLWWRSSRQSMTAFIRANRAELSARSMALVNVEPAR